MTRAWTGYVSRYQRSRVWSSDFYRTERFTLTCDFKGALLDGVTVESVTWQSFNPANVILADALSYSTKATVSCTAGLEPGSMVKCEATLSNGQIINQLFAVNVRPSPWFCEDTIPAQGPCHISAVTPITSYTLVKAATPETFQEAGDEIEYSYTIVNNGTVTMTDIVVTDDKAGVATCPSDTLEAGDTMVCTVTYTVTQDDVDAGEITNTATLTANTTDPDQETVVTTDTTDLTIQNDAAPAFTIAKSSVSTEFTEWGQEVEYDYLVTNTGNVGISAISIADDKVDTVVCPFSELGEGDSMVCTGTYTITYDDIAAGEVTNTAVLSGTPNAGVFVDPNPEDDLTIPYTSPFPEVWWLVSNDTTTFSGTNLSTRLWRAAIPGGWGIVTNSVARNPQASAPPEAGAWVGEACYVFGQSNQAERYTSFTQTNPQVGTVVTLASPDGLPGTEGIVHKWNEFSWTGAWVSTDNGATVNTIQAPTGGNADGAIQGITIRDDGRWLITMGRDGGGDYDLWYSDAAAPQAGDWTDIGQIGSPTVSCGFFLRNDTHICGFGNAAGGMLRTSSLTAGASWTNIAYGAEWDGEEGRCGFSYGGTMIVGTFGGTNARLMRSTDGGSTWAAVAVGTDDAGIINNDIQRVQYGGGYWVASTASNLVGADYARIFASSDDGVTWAEVSNPTSLEVSPSNALWIPFYVGTD